MAHETVALDEVTHVTDPELIARVSRLVRADQTLNARLLVHLGELDARGLYREQAYASMFTYCVEELRMSEAQAYLRIQAARLGRQFPRVLQLLAQGALHLTAIKLLGPHLTADNHLQLLERASGQGKRDIELLVAAIAPKPDVPNRTRKLPAGRAHPADAEPSSPRAAAQSAPTSVETKQAPFALEASVTSSPVGASNTLNATPRVDGHGVPSRAPFALEAPRQRGSSTPLSPGRYKVEFTAGEVLHGKLAQLKDLLRHQVPDGDLAVVVERAVDLLIDHSLKQRFAQTRAPKARRSAKRHNAHSRYIPRAVVREVHQRDAGQCTFVSSDGKRCAERGFLELHHHDRPYARGGKATVENLRLVCRAHNALFAERDFGRALMRSKRMQTRDPSGGLAPERVCDDSVLPAQEPTDQRTT
jgi:hypothetical protein